MVLRRASRMPMSEVSQRGRNDFEFQIRTALRGRRYQMLYRNYFLRCPNACAIPLPRPSRAKIDGSLVQITMENREAIFVCPYCGLVSAYCGQDIVEMLTVDTPSLFQAHECALVCVELECVDKNCESQKVVHAIQGVAKGTWRPKVCPKEWMFSDTARCSDGHKLRFDPAVEHPRRMVHDPF